MSEGAQTMTNIKKKSLGKAQKGEVRLVLLIVCVKLIYQLNTEKKV